jgi:hypothetical protein
LGLVQGMMLLYGIMRFIATNKYQSKCFGFSLVVFFIYFASFETRSPYEARVGSKLAILPPQHPGAEIRDIWLQ